MVSKPIPGFLNRYRRNIQALDESIEDARKVPKDEKPTDKRARLKLLRDLVELQNSSLAAVKVHLLGRDETGAPTEPDDSWGEHNITMFERYFDEQLQQEWTEDSLELECEECQKNARDVVERRLIVSKDKEFGGNRTQDRTLCQDCFDKLQAEYNKQITEQEQAKASEQESTSPEKAQAVGQWQGLLKELEGIQF